MGFIYVITNTTNNKQYVGKTENSVIERFAEHKHSINTDRDKERPLYRAMRKYGVDNFICKQLEECPSIELNEREQYWIEKLDTFYHGYNCTLGGDGGVLYNRDAIYQRYLAVQSIAQVAREFNCDRRVVRSAINSHGIYHNKNRIRPVFQIDKTSYQIIASFDSISAASRAMTRSSSQGRAAIKNACDYLGKTGYGFLWCYQDEYNQNNFIKQVRHNCQVMKERRSQSLREAFAKRRTTFSYKQKKKDKEEQKLIEQQNKKQEKENFYNKIVDAYKRYLSIAEVVKIFPCNRETVRKALRYYNIIPRSSEQVNRDKWGDVMQLSLDGRIILGHFKSAKEASQIILGDSKGAGNIAACCRGQQVTAYGYKWQRLQQEENIGDEQSSKDGNDS